MVELDILDYVRRPFEVQAVLITEKNLQAVSDWCEGEVRETADGQQFIKVKVYRPMSSRQTRAFVGDWVLYSGKDGQKGAYKVYTQKAFEQSFVPKEGDI